MTMVSAQAMCSALAYLVYQQSHEVVLIVSGVLSVVWLALLVVFVRMPTPAREQKRAARSPSTGDPRRPRPGG